MAKANYVAKARRNIYQHGKRVKHIGKGEKNKGKEIVTTDVTQPRDKDDKIIIRKGESYYWWQFKDSDKSYSKEAPKRSQLTRSGYLSTLYDIADQMENTGHITDADELQGFVEEIKEQIESLKDETQSSLDNMPEQLQEGSILNERIEQLENAYNELDGIDTDYEEPNDDDLRDEAEEELADEKPEEDDFEDNSEYEDAKAAWDQAVDKKIEELKEDKLQEWLQEKQDEIAGISLE